MHEIPNVPIESWSSRLIFRWENHFLKDQMKFCHKTCSELWKFPIFDNSNLPDSKLLAKDIKKSCDYGHCNTNTKIYWIMPDTTIEVLINV